MITVSRKRRRSNVGLGYLVYARGVMNQDFHNGYK